MDKQAFIRNYIATFLATYDAINYDMNCLGGWQTHSQPVEDAAELATKAWEKLSAILS